jgi:hypothetical protein
LDITDVKIRKEELLEVLDKVESLIKTGVKADLIEAYDVSYQKKRIRSLRKQQDYKDFKSSDDYREFRELMRVCGMVCCKVVVSPESPVGEYECNQCPIFAFEKFNL